MVKFSEPPDFSEQPNGKAAPTWTFSRILILSIVLLMGVGLTLVGRDMTPQNYTENQSDTTVKVEASQLYKDFDANGARAVKKYANKRIQITGIIDRITFNGKPVVYLKTSSLFSSSSVSVHINLVESDWGKAEDYNKGQQKTFHCESVDEWLGNPILYDCIDYDFWKF
jgi:hypothetical protein